MHEPTNELIVVMFGVVLGGVVTLAAVVALAWATATRARSRAAATVAFGLWCAVAGGTLSGALWSWMTRMNWEYQSIVIGSRYPGQETIDFERESMGMTRFYLRLDGVFRRGLYAPALLPLAGSIWLLRIAGRRSSEKDKAKPIGDEFTSPWSG